MKAVTVTSSSVGTQIKKNLESDKDGTYIFSIRADGVTLNMKINNAEFYVTY